MALHLWILIWLLCSQPGFGTWHGGGALLAKMALLVAVVLDLAGVSVWPPYFRIGRSGA